MSHSKKRDVIKMCGRFVIDDSGDIAEMRRIFEELKKHYSDTVEFQNVKRGEIYPSDTVPIIIPEKELSIDAVPMQWGIKSKNYDKLIINARSEGVYQKAMFMDAIANKRCVIPANGFYEWAKLYDKKEKYLIQPANTQMLYFAGLYQKFRDPFEPGKEQVRFAIMTTEAKGHIRSLHARMPVTVQRKDILKWLNGGQNHVGEILYEHETPEYTFKNLGSVG